MNQHYFVSESLLIVALQCALAPRFALLFLFAGPAGATRFRNRGKVRDFRAPRLLVRKFPDRRRL